jgi:hypothetical protein
MRLFLGCFSVLYEDDLIEHLVSTLHLVSEPMPPSSSPTLLLAASFRNEPIESRFFSVIAPIFDVVDVAPNSAVWPALRKEMIR